MPTGTADTTVILPKKKLSHHCYSFNCSIHSQAAIAAAATPVQHCYCCNHSILNLVWRSQAVIVTAVIAATSSKKSQNTITITRYFDHLSSKIWKIFHISLIASILESLYSTSRHMGIIESVKIYMFLVIIWLSEDGCQTLKVILIASFCLWGMWNLKST